jgi:hypothetical protein
MAYAGAPATYAQYAAEQPAAYSAYPSASPVTYAAQTYGAPPSAIMPDMGSMAQYSAAPQYAFEQAPQYVQATDAAAYSMYAQPATMQTMTMNPYGATTQTPSYTANYGTYGTSVAMQPSFQPPGLQMPSTGSFVATPAGYGYGGAPAYGGAYGGGMEQYGQAPALSTQSFAYSGATPYQFQFYPDYGKSEPAPNRTAAPPVSDKPKPPAAKPKPAPKAAAKKKKKRCGCC